LISPEGTRLDPLLGNFIEVRCEGVQRVRVHIMHGCGRYLELQLQYLLNACFLISPYKVNPLRAPVLTAEFA